MAFDSKFKKIYESLMDLYYPYMADEDYSNAGNPNQPKLKAGDTVNVLLISDKSMRTGEKSDTARDYVVAKISEDGNKLELTPKQAIKQLNLETGAMEDYLGEPLKVDLSKQKGKLVATTNPDNWMLQLTVASEPLFGKKEEKDMEDGKEAKDLDKEKDLKEPKAKKK